MKKLITIFLVFSVSIFSAQQSAKVIYKVIKSAKNNRSETIRKQYGESFYQNSIKKYDKIYAVAKDFDFILEFNPNESIYYWQEEMKDETISYYTFILARLLGGGMAKQYQNKKDSLIMRQSKSPKTRELHRETSSLYKYKWHITKETDSYLGYTIIKAVSGHHEVWFTPQIPVPFGPMGFGGLPGLILKYRNTWQFPSFELMASKIKFYKKPLKIKKPKKGKLRTEEEGRASRIKEINQQN